MATKYIIDNLAEQTISGSLSATSFSADTFYGDGSNLTGVSGGSFTGGTVNGETIFDGGLSATTFSATTIDLCTSNGTLYTDSISGCSPINILSPANFTQGISADTIYVSGNPITQPYKVYTALLTQTGSTAPEAIVLENTLGGDVIWSRSSVGNYTATLSGAFPDENKFYSQPITQLSQIRYMGVYWYDVNSFTVDTSEFTSYNGAGTVSDNFLFKQPIEIRVYN